MERITDIREMHVQVHANAFPELVDSVIQILGPHVEFIGEIFSNVCTSRHVTEQRQRKFDTIMGLFSFSFLLLIGQATKGHERESVVLSIDLWVRH